MRAKAHMAEPDPEIPETPSARFRCSACGGVVIGRIAPGRCPSCGGSVWEFEESRMLRSSGDDAAA
jgi:rubrerythrin